MPLAAREITSGEDFAQGAVPAGAQLVAIANGQTTAVQMDVKTRYADGSVATAVLTLAQPTLAAYATLRMSLGVAPPSAAPAAPPVDISALAMPGSGYDLQIGLTLHNADGTTTPVAISAAQALGAALSSGAYSTWLSGPQATQVRVDVPVSGSLHLTLDITRYADGNTSTDVQFNNDIAMSASGGTAVYDAVIYQHGAVAFLQAGITQYQYTTWDTTIATNGVQKVNVQRDISALEKSGLVQNYDASNGVAGSLIANEAQQMAPPGFASVLGSAGITRYMPDVGGRADIGPTTAWNAAWLMTQNATAAQFALDQAEAAGSIPWHFRAPAGGDYVTLGQYPTLWDDPRAGQYGIEALTQAPATPAATGWTPDTAHTPDLDYVAYLMTGDRYYLDQLNAEATYGELADWPVYRHAGNGIVANGSDQLRAQGWSLRSIVEAAAANPDGSAEKAYFTGLETANFDYLLTEIGSLSEGQASGWLPGTYGSNGGAIPPWQQDYFATTVVLAAEQGSVAAQQVLGWETNFLAGRFLAEADGFSPYLGVAYNLQTYASGTSQIGGALQTWAAIAQQSVANGVVDPSTITTETPDDYAQTARAALAGDVTVTEDPRAIEAYGWLSAYESQTLSATGERTVPQWDIVPRLSDGNLLTAANTIILSDAGTAGLVGSPTADQLIYETGAGDVTIQGGSGINILFAGAGADTLIGGSGADYLFAGSGGDTLSAGGGANYMRAGSGADTFVLDSRVTATDIIADFKLGIDHLHVLDASGAPVNADGIAGVIGATTSDAQGSAVLHLSGAHTVTLGGVAASALSASTFS